MNKTTLPTKTLWEWAKRSVDPTEMGRRFLSGATINALAAEFNVHTNTANNVLNMLFGPARIWQSVGKTRYVYIKTLCRIAFGGTNRAYVRSNWAYLFSGTPDQCAEYIRERDGENSIITAEQWRVALEAAMQERSSAVAEMMDSLTAASSHDDAIAQKAFGAYRKQTEAMRDWTHLIHDTAPDQAAEA